MLAGLKVRRIVIDPGHGGHDPGAIGPSGVFEKDLALDIAFRLKEEFQRNTDLEVLLTREDDRYLALEARTAFANKKSADLFVSVHLNADANHRFRGIETFFLNITDDRYSIKLAARENATSEKSISDLNFILADLTLKSNVDDSIQLSRYVQGSLVNSMSREYDQIEDLGVKSALFYVLIGARMPSILVEASFISHPKDERRLKTRAYREGLAKGIFQGLKQFVDERNRVGRPEI